MLEYSDEAQNSRFLFTNTPIVYVEGQDDISFWSDLFKKVNFVCTIEDVNGSKIKDYANNIIHHSASYLVAMDRDYLNYKSISYDHNNIIITPCHSIENIIFCKKSILKLIKKRSYLKDNQLTPLEEELDEELRKFKEKTLPLLRLDILNDVHEKSLKILSTHYEKCFSWNDERIKEIEKNFSETELNNPLINEQIQNNFFLEVRGHFLEHWASDLIRKLVQKYGPQKMNIDNNSLKLFLEEFTCSPYCDFIENFLQYILNKVKNYNTVKDSISKQQQRSNI